MKSINITLKTFYGFEEVLKEELEELGYQNIEILNRAVRLKGDWTDIPKLNYQVRCAISVLVELSQFEIKSEKDLYIKSKMIPWTELFDVKKTIAIKGAVNSTIFKHSQYPFLLVKDAIADSFREKTGERPDVNIKQPQVAIDLYVRNNEVTLSLNTSGVPLFQRGYRSSTGEAPLNEVVAACLIRLSGWDRKITLIDPFCGSGTILAEAAMLACGVPAGVERHHYAFKNLKNFDPQAWEELQNSFPRVIKSLPCQLIGSDCDSSVLLKAKRNLNNFSFGRFIDFSVNSMQERDYPSAPAMIITNPPYGERLEAEIIDLYKEIGDTFKNKMPGYSCWMVSSSEEGFKEVGLRPSRKIRVFNGDLECSFRKYEMYDGTKKGPKVESEA